MQQFMKPCNYSLGLRNSKQILHKYEKKKQNQVKSRMEAEDPKN